MSVVGIAKAGPDSAGGSRAILKGGQVDELDQAPGQEPLNEGVNETWPNFRKGGEG